MTVLTDALNNFSRTEVWYMKLQREECILDIGIDPCQGGIENSGIIGAAPAVTDVALVSAEASGVDDFYNSMSIHILDGPAAGDIREIADYVGATKRVFPVEDFSAVPTAGSAYEIIDRPGGCFNSFSTCQDPPNFDGADIFDEFCSWPLDPFPGKSILPIIEDVSIQPTQIKDKLPTTLRITITLMDGRDNDVGFDKNVATRPYDPETQSTLLKKYFEKYTNYRGKTVELSYGVMGIDISDYEQRAVGLIEDVKFSHGKVQLVVVDTLTDLKEIIVPPRTNLSLVSDITDTSTEATLNSTEGLYPAPAAIALGNKEYVSYTAIDAVTNVISGLTRGIRGTIAVAHSEGVQVKPVLHIGPMNPFDAMKALLLTYAGWPAARVNSVAIDAARDFPGEDVDVELFSHKSMGIDKRLYPLVDLFDCNIFVAEDVKATVVRRVPNDPSRVYTPLTDEGNILSPLDKVDLNTRSQYTSVTVNWDPVPFGDISDEDDFHRVTSAVDSDAVSEYAMDIEYVMNTEWIRNGYLNEDLLIQNIFAIIGRRLMRTRDPQKIITVDVDIADGAIKTGGFAQLDTDIWNNATGGPLVEWPGQVIYRKHKKKGRINIRVIEVPKRRICLFAAAGVPDYSLATEDERQHNGFFSGPDGKVEGDPPYVFY